jgi:hypothetical protein
MKTITKLEYEIIRMNKALSDRLEKMQEEYYQEIVKILKQEDDNGWVVDYFFNENLNIDEMLENSDIEVEG